MYARRFVPWVPVALRLIAMKYWSFCFETPWASRHLTTCSMSYFADINHESPVGVFELQKTRIVFQTWFKKYFCVHFGGCARIAVTLDFQPGYLSSLGTIV
jgi:hypothetical protein